MTMPYSRSLSGTPSATMKDPSRIGTAPFSPANITKLFSFRPRPDPARSGSRARGRTTRVRTRAIASPGTHTSGEESVPRWMVRPSTTKARISPMLASAEWKCSISRMYGARASPIRIPATKTARNPAAAFSQIRP